MLKDEVNFWFEKGLRTVFHIMNHFQTDFPVVVYDDDVGMKENAARGRRLLEEGHERAGARI